VCCNATCESFVRTGSYALRPIAERRRCPQRRVASLCESEDTYGKSSWADPRERPARVFYPLFLSVIRRKFRERTSNLLTSSLCFSTLPNDREPARKESRGRGGKHVKNRNRLDLSATTGKQYWRCGENRELVRHGPNGLSLIHRTSEGRRLLRRIGRWP